MYECHHRGKQAPGYHYAGNPAPRAPGLDQYRAGNLKHKVTYEKDSGSETEDLITEANGSGHLKRRITEVDPIKVGYNKQHEQVGHEAARNAPPGGPSYYVLASEARLHNRIYTGLGAVSQARVPKKVKCSQSCGGEMAGVSKK